MAFYSDKFSVFRVNSPACTHKDAITQFSRALSVLGIELICANSPQAKGRIERAFKVFKDRLVKELRLRGIDNYQDANLFLFEFIPENNRRFAVLPRSTGEAHIALDFLFPIHGSRKISKDLQIQFNNVI